MLLPGVPREESVPFTRDMISLFLDIVFEDDFPEEVMKIREIVEKLAADAMESNEGTGCAEAPGGC